MSNQYKSGAQKRKEKRKRQEGNKGLRDFLHKDFKKGGDDEAGTSEVNVEQGKKQRSQCLTGQH